MDWGELLKAMIAEREKLDAGILIVQGLYEAQLPSSKRGRGRPPGSLKKLELFEKGIALTDDDSPIQRISGRQGRYNRKQVNAS